MPSVKAVVPCLVCRRDGASLTRLPSGALAHLCPDCAGDERRVIEAERRVAADRAR